MKLHRPVAYAGPSGPIEGAGSPACRGSRSGKIEADCNSEIGKNWTWFKAG
jgi:hypothetical protein